MIRESTAGSRHAFMTIAASSRVSFQRRRQAGQASTDNSMPANGRTWVRLTRAGNVFTAYASANVTSHDNAASTQADFQDIATVE